MNFPEEYTCHGVPVTIEIVRNLNDESKLAYYSTVSGRPRIVARDSMPVRLKELTLAHEVLHSWFHFSGVTNTMPEGQEELFCDAVAPLLVEFMKTVVKENQN